MKYRIGITDYVRPPYDVEGQAFADAEYIFLNSEDEREFDPMVLAGLDALITWHAQIGELTAKRLVKGKIVVRYGVGFDSIDIQALHAERIHFCNTPDYGTEEVADTASGMVLNIQRKINSYDLACRSYSSGWQEHVQPPIKRTNTQILGVVGVGRIGTALINRLRPFGYQILGYDPYQPSGHEKAIGYQRRYHLADLLAESDIISVHCPLNGETRGMMDDDFISMMKSGAALVNTGRGQVLSDFDCLEKHLRSGHLRAAAFDVLPAEPPPPNHPLIKAWKDNEPWIAGRLIINPHTSYFSEEALFEMRFKAAETTRMFFEEEVLRNQVLP
ncbi:MAG: C-terminal binding protein [Gammaproteobacteria bacterium]|nr:C-terminal binding protein [Gammaproteobacteria bacterium]